MPQREETKETLRPEVRHSAIDATESADHDCRCLHLIFLFHMSSFRFAVDFCPEGSSFIGDLRG